MSKRWSVLLPAIALLVLAGSAAAEGPEPLAAPAGEPSVEAAVVAALDAAPLCTDGAAPQATAAVAETVPNPAAADALSGETGWWYGICWTSCVQCTASYQCPWGEQCRFGVQCP